LSDAPTRRSKRICTLCLCDLVRLLFRSLLEAPWEAGIEQLLNEASNRPNQEGEVRMTRSKNLISRRDTLRLIGAAGATAVVAWSGEPSMRFLAPGKRGSVVSAQSLSCIVRPQLTEGPYFCRREAKPFRHQNRSHDWCSESWAPTPVEIQRQPFDWWLLFPLDRGIR
jgi:hypothetical protein